MPCAARVSEFWFVDAAGELPYVDAIGESPFSDGTEETVSPALFFPTDGANSRGVNSSNPTVKDLGLLLRGRERGRAGSFVG